jgi:ATP-dependent Lon protease
MQHEDKKTTMTDQTNATIPVLPLRDVVVYPHMVIPLFVGREKSIRALDAAMQSDKRILLVAQRSADVDDPQVEDIHSIGTLSSILQLLKLPDGTVKVLVEGAGRARIKRFDETEDFFSAEIESAEPQTVADDREVEVLMRSLLALFDQYVKLNKKVPPEILTSLSGIDDAGRLADTIAAHMSLKIEEKQHILEIDSVRGRLEHLMGLIEGEIDILQIEKRIRGRVKQQMEKSQREYYLNEQMKAIQKELGELEDAPNEVEELQQKIDKAGMTKEAREKAQAELNKLKMMSPMSAEATVVRNYIDWLVSVPWKKRTKIHHDLTAAERVLEEDHYGLDKVKERILEYLAVQQRVRKLKGRSCAWSGHPVSARPRWAVPSRVRPTASSCACRWAACATRRRSAVTAAPTSAPCRASWCRIWPRSACATRCSCWTRSIRCRWISAAIRRRRCSRCSTRNRTTPSAIIISRWISISRM